MPIIRWNPFWMDDALEDFFEGKALAPAIDVYEKDGKIFVEAPLPGADPKKVDVDIENGVLTIKGSEEKKSEVEEKNYYKKEVRHGSFYRSVRLPVPVAEDKVEANFKDGVLVVSAPKAKAKNAKKPVKIKVVEK